MSATIAATGTKVGTVKSNEVVLEPTHPLHIVSGDRRRKPTPLTEVEARDLTIEIRRTSVRLWILVVEAHDRGAHTALGYDTWADYVKAELKISESRSYQLLDTGHVMRELAVAGVNVDEMDPPPARVVSRIKDRLPDLRRTAEDAIKKGHDVDKAVRALAREPRKGDKPTRTAATASAAAAAGTTDTTTAATGASGQMVKCPACGGEGKVGRSLAGKLRAALRQLE